MNSIRLISTRYDFSVQCYAFLSTATHGSWEAKWFYLNFIMLSIKKFYMFAYLFLLLIYDWNDSLDSRVTIIGRHQSVRTCIHAGTHINLHTHAYTHRCRHSHALIYKSCYNISIFPIVVWMILFHYLNASTYCQIDVFKWNKKPLWQVWQTPYPHPCLSCIFLTVYLDSFSGLLSLGIQLC